MELSTFFIYTPYAVTRSNALGALVFGKRKLFHQAPENSLINIRIINNITFIYKLACYDNKEYAR